MSHDKMKQILFPAVLSHLSLMPLCPLLNAGHVILDIGTIRGKTSTHSPSPV